MEDIPIKALSIMQPWAWLIVNRHKAIENRDWPTRFRGPVAIHAGKKVDLPAAMEVTNGIHPVTGEISAIEAPDRWQTGGIVGVADIVDCVTSAVSPWFVGRYGFVLANQRPVDFIPVRGELGFFDWRKNVVTSKEASAPDQRSMF
jgi:hypothetical protein